MVRMLVTQDSFRSFNELHKQNHLCMHVLLNFKIFYYYYLLQTPATVLKEASHHYFSDEKSSLNIHLSSKDTHTHTKQKKSTDLVKLHDYNRKLDLNFNAFQSETLFVDATHAIRWSTSQPCICVVKLVHVYVQCVILCCPGFNSAIPPLSHYHTEQTECVCWVVKLSSALEQHAPPNSSPAELPACNL